MKEMMIKKAEELQNDQEFMDQLHRAKTMEEAAKVFAAYGIELTVEQLQSGYESALAYCAKHGAMDDELSEESLDAVVGGANGYVYTVGMGAAYAGIALMPTPLGIGLWAGGCLVALCGAFM